MNKEVYDARLFFMGIDPETGKNTIRVEVELDDEDFGRIKNSWIDSDDLTIRILDP